MARVKKAQLGDSVKSVAASWKRTIGDTAAQKRKADSLGVSTSKAKEALKARIAAKKQRSGGKISAKASNVSKKLGSAKKSIGNMRFTKKKK